MKTNNLLIRKTKTYYQVEYHNSNKMATAELLYNVIELKGQNSNNGVFKVPLKYKAFLIQWANKNFLNSEIVEKINGEDVIKDFKNDQPKAIQPELNIGA